MTIQPAAQPATQPTAEPTAEEAWNEAYASAHLDNRELEWLAEAHMKAWRNHDIGVQIVCMKRASVIEGKAWPARKQFRDRRDDDQKDYDEAREEMELGGTSLLHQD